MLHLHHEQVVPFETFGEMILLQDGITRLGIDHPKRICQALKLQDAIGIIPADGAVGAKMDRNISFNIDDGPVWDGGGGERVFGENS
mgnify:CR=1 FL=1